MTAPQDAPEQPAMSPAGRLSLALIEHAVKRQAGVAALANIQPLRDALAKLSPFDVHAIAEAVVALDREGKLS